MRFPIYHAILANFRAVRTRRLIERCYRKDPQATTDLVNAKLDEANRAEYKRTTHHLPVVL